MPYVRRARLSTHMTPAANSNDAIGVDMSESFDFKYIVLGSAMGAQLSNIR